MKRSSTVILASLFAAIPNLQAATKYVDLAGPATGYIAVANFKNGSRDSLESSATGHNGLPDYPNYQMANNGYTAIISSPLSASSDFSAFGGFSSGTAGGNPISVNNQINTDPRYSTMSAGMIGYDSALLTGVGNETIPVGSLTFDFNTYLWDGKTSGDGGPYTVTSTPTYISPFSPILSSYNDGGGAGNAAIAYNISLSNVTGTGLHFVDGQLVSMDIDGALSVLLRVGYNFPALDSPWLSMLSVTFTGDFSTDGLDYQFDIADTKSAALWSGIHMVMNREGTASMIPEPSAAVASGVALLGLLARRRRA